MNTYRSRRGLRLAREIYSPSLGRTIFNVAATWLLILAVGLLCRRFFFFSVWFVAGCAMGVLQYRINVLAHDGLHYSLAKSRLLNDWICRWFLSAPHGAPLDTLRANHLNHHRTVGSNADADSHYYKVERFRGSWHFQAWIASSFFLNGALGTVSKLAKMRRTTKRPGPLSVTPDMIAICVTQCVIALGLWGLSGKYWAYLPLWALPMVTIMMGLNTVRSCLEHANVSTGPEVERRWTFKPTWVERVILSPFNMNFHAEHHSHMTVPYWNLPAVRQAMLVDGTLVPTQIQLSYFSRYRQLIRQVAQSKKIVDADGVDYFNRGHWLSDIQIFFSLRARRRMFGIWTDYVGTGHRLIGRVLDVGGTPDTQRDDSNCMIPWIQELASAVDLYSPEDLSALKDIFPGVGVLAPAGVSDPLPIESRCYDWVTCSAVIEHVGCEANQEQFLCELGRVADGIFLSTPNRAHWLEFHTKIPLIHWLPRPAHRAVLGFLGFSVWKLESHLRLLSRRNLAKIAARALGDQFEIQVRYVWSLGMPSNLILLASRKSL